MNYLNFSKTHTFVQTDFKPATEGLDKKEFSNCLLCKVKTVMLDASNIGNCQLDFSTNIFKLVFLRFEEAWIILFNTFFSVHLTIIVSLAHLIGLDTINTSSLIVLLPLPPLLLLTPAPPSCHCFSSCKKACPDHYYFSYDCY